MQTVYIISGPAGVGKSTTSSALVNAMANCAYISGDDVSHMHVRGRQKPWESKTELNLIWNNILSLTRNFIQNKMDVIIDFVTFPDDAQWFKDQLQDMEITVIYVVLYTNPETLLNRDQLRAPDNQMGERCIILLEEFRQLDINKKHLLDTSAKNTDDISEIVHEIMNNIQYRIEN
ncbi:AAA family ATPase [Bacillus sp. FJAT-49736]|uniref:AAA family ATPase n=1 Tax=Bacillus sp. FJAT-49736 TaxID=2833582 RepID=UPI001BC9E9B0|nr:AAA family ATPase [Bacillus sp. FJAT-49736]MBS4172884.1 AAA family ATPase [Bacillus sp. FJAT-49736]